VNYKFDIEIVLDAPIGPIVAAYMDAEHYVHLHKDNTSKYTVFEKLNENGLKIKARQYWKFLGCFAGHECVSEYIPPTTFRHYNFKPVPWWIPSVHHLVKIQTTLNHYPDDTQQKTISRTRVEIDMPFWLYPFRTWMKRWFRKIKKRVSDEDMDMILRRGKIFGRNNINSYLVKSHFLLYKEEFVRHFAAKPIGE